MKKKMEDIAKEIQEEVEELFDFVKQSFAEIMEGLGVPAPERKLPRLHTKVMFFLRQKDFLKTLLDVERRGHTYYGSTVEKHPLGLPNSRICARTLVDKRQENGEEILAYILVNGTRIRSGSIKEKMDLKEYATIILIHEMLHTLEQLTGVSFLKSTFVAEDGFTTRTYEAWRRRK